MQPQTLAVASLLVCLAGQDARELLPVRHPTCLRFYSLEGDVKPDVLRKAVAGLVTKATPARIALGPSAVSSRPKGRFLALELPAGMPAKDAQAALKKVCSRAEELAWCAFQGKDRQLPSILGFAALDCVVGMDNDMRWFDLEAGRARFFYLPAKLDSKAIRARFENLYKPFDAGELGNLVGGTLEWKLAEPLDAAAAKAAEKAIAKLPGVKKARLDVEKRLLVAEIEHDGLRGASPAGGPSGEGSQTRLPAADFLVDDVLDALAAAHVGLEPTAAAAPEKR